MDRTVGIWILDKYPEDVEVIKDAIYLRIKLTYGDAEWFSPSLNNGLSLRVHIDIDCEDCSI